MIGSLAISIVALTSVLLVALVGFAAHRASLCTVRAVAEIMTSGTAWMLSSFAKAALWTLRFAGELLMGIGGAVIPGGNDTLILAAIPTLSPWALATYVALLVGVAISLLMMRTRMGALPRVECVGDRCK